MTKPFIGFSSDRQRTVRVPDGFFAELLPAITSMLEMKVTLHLFWLLSKGERSSTAPRMCNLAELERDESLKASFHGVKGPRTPAEALREGLELAVARGTLLHLWVREEASANGRSNGHDPSRSHEGTVEQWFLLNTRENKTWVESLAQGKVEVSSTPLGGTEARASTVRVVAERPTIYSLYEQNIGLLTPILAEKLQDAEGRFPLGWIEAAFEEAVSNNKRNWRYIEKILERWAAEGKQSNGQARGSVERTLDPDKYTKGKYAFLFRPD